MVFLDRDNSRFPVAAPVGPRNQHDEELTQHRQPAREELRLCPVSEQHSPVGADLSVVGERVRSAGRQATRAGSQR